MLLGHADGSPERFAAAFGKSRSNAGDMQNFRLLDVVLIQVLGTHQAGGGVFAVVVYEGLAGNGFLQHQSGGRFLGQFHTGDIHALAADPLLDHESQRVLA
ncbi:hypothetical protein D3C76_1452540 [compost metagenome]